MAFLKAITVATDFSAEAQHTQRRAALLAGEHKAALTLLHVLSRSALDDLREFFGQELPVEADLREAALQSLQIEAADIRRFADCEPETALRTGKIVDEIVALGAQSDLLALGAYGLSPMRDALIGSIADRVLNRTEKPLLVVRRGVTGPYQHVIVPIDFSANSLLGLDMALDFAPQATITIVHAYEVPYESTLQLAGMPDLQLNGYRLHAQRRAQARISELIAARPQHKDRILRVVEHGDPAPLILSETERIQADLIVIGKSGQSTVEKFLLGSVSRHIVADALADVLVVPPPGVDDVLGL